VEGFRQPAAHADPGRGVLISTAPRRGIGTRVWRWAGTADDGQEVWTSSGLKPYFNDTVVHDGYAYGYDNGILSCIDLGTALASGRADAMASAVGPVERPGLAAGGVGGANSLSWRRCPVSSPNWQTPGDERQDVEHRWWRARFWWCATGVKWWRSGYHSRRVSDVGLLRGQTWDRHEFRNGGEIRSSPRFR